MTNGQIAQLQELSKCYGFRRFERNFVTVWTNSGYFNMTNEKMNQYDKSMLRRLAHQYRHQIKAMKRNKRVA